MFGKVFGNDEQHGPLPPLLLMLTIVTGIVDAVSYLALNHVFVANMTGNVVFLGFAVAGSQEFSMAASLLAIAAFLAGALAGGRFGMLQEHRGRFLAIVVLIEIVLIGLALAVSLIAASAVGVSYVLISLLALALGLQNAAARRLGVPDLTTTVLTLTLTGLAADSNLAGGKNSNLERRLAAIAAMFAGAALGAFLVLRAGVVAPLAVACTLLVLTAIAAMRQWSTTAAWTAGPRASAPIART